MQTTIYTCADDIADDLRAAVPDHHLPDDVIEDTFEAIRRRGQVLTVLPRWLSRQEISGDRIHVGTVERETDDAVQFRSLNGFQNRHRNHADALHVWIPKSQIEFAARAED